MGQKAFPQRGRGAGWGRDWQFEGNRTKICHLLHVKCISRSPSNPYKARSFPNFLLESTFSCLQGGAPKTRHAPSVPDTRACASRDRSRDPGSRLGSAVLKEEGAKGTAGCGTGLRVAVGGGLRGEKGLHEQPSRGKGRNVGLQEVGVASRPGA